MSQRFYRLTCGCLVERGSERIVEFCCEHDAQYLEIHERAVRDHDAKPRHWFESNTDGYSTGQER